MASTVKIITGVGKKPMALFEMVQWNWLAVSIFPAVSKTFLYLIRCDDLNKQMLFDTCTVLFIFDLDQKGENS